MKYYILSVLNHVGLVGLKYFVVGPENFVVGPEDFVVGPEDFVVGPKFFDLVNFFNTVLFRSCKTEWGRLRAKFSCKSSSWY